MGAGEFDEAQARYREDRTTAAAVLLLVVDLEEEQRVKRAPAVAGTPGVRTPFGLARADRRPDRPPPFRTVPDQEFDLR